MITSITNQRLKRVKALLEKARVRKKEQCYIAEGRRLLLEVPKQNVEMLFLSESMDRQWKQKAEEDPEREWAEWLAGMPCEIVSDSVFNRISDTVTPQGILGIVKQPVYTLAQILSRAGHSVLFLENIQDPGNLGTIFRTAEAAGVRGIVMNDGCVDVFNPKVIRATMGAIYRVPFTVMPLADAVGQFRKAGGTVYAAHLKGTAAHYETEYRGTAGFLIGNEGNGLTEETAALADCYLRIPMEGQTESLNAAVAAALLVYEAKRQSDAARIGKRGGTKDAETNVETDLETV